MSTEIEQKTVEIRRALSQLSEGKVEDHVEFIRKTACLYYNNENQMNEIHRRLSASANVRSSARASVWNARDQVLQCK